MGTNYVAQNSTTVSALNEQLQQIQEALEDTLSRSGASPNESLSDYDMNGNRILNLPAPSSPTEPVRLQDLPNPAILDKATIVDNVQKMKTTNFSIGDYVVCKRYYAGGELVDGLIYEIQATQAVDGYADHTLSNGNIAKLIVGGTVYLKHFGVRTDPTGIYVTDNTNGIQAAFDRKGNIQGILDATYFLNKEITIGANTTYYAMQANHKQHATWAYTGTSYTTVIVLGDASSTTGDNLDGCHILDAVVTEDFLGDSSIPADIDNLANYTSIADYGIRAQRTDNSSIVNCTVSGMPTSGMGAEWSNNFIYKNNKITIVRFHGIANQGGTAVARSHRLENNLVIGAGGMAFDINTATGGTVSITNNICRNVRQFYKSTDGAAYSSNNECFSWSETDDIFSAYGNSQGLNAVNDKLYNFARLTSSGSTNANYQWSNITYISNNGSLLTVQQGTTYKISDSVIDITTDKSVPMVTHSSTGDKSGFSLSITDCDLAFNTTASANSSGFGVISLSGWKNATINISNNKKFTCTGLSSQRIIIGIASDITSTSGLAVVEGNNIDSIGYDPQLGLFLKDSHNNLITNNNITGVAVGSYETTEDSAVNFVQHTNFSDVQFTLPIGSNNRIFDYLSLGRSGATSPVGAKTPNFIGERFYVWTLGDFYQAFGTLDTQWHKLNP